MTLPNGVRFQGSVCPTREEAAESAASMALLVKRFFFISAESLWGQAKLLMRPMC